MAPKTAPTTVPRMATVNATFPNFSFLVFAITARIIAAGPKTIGNKRKDTPPKVIPRIE